MPPIPVRELTRSYALRYSNTQHEIHGNFSQGMLRDVASWESPEGYSWTASDLLADTEGKLRKRGGYTSPSGSNTIAVAEWMAAFKSGSIDAISTLFGTLGKGGLNIKTWNRATGASTAILTDAANDTVACKPFQHGNLMVCAFQSKGMTTSDRNKLYFAGGGAANGITITAATITANDNRITGISGPTLVASNLGSIIEVDDGTPTHIYTGRIVEVTSGTACRVESIPLTSFTATSGIIQAAWTPTLFSGGNVVTGKFGCSYQGRVVFANTQLTGNPTSSYAKGLDNRPNRVIWSKLSAEAPIAVSGATTVEGLAALYPGFFGENNLTTMYNYVDIPSLDAITGLAAAGEGNLIVFGKRATFRISGTLDTLTSLDPTPTFSVDQISANIGCVEPRSIQYTRAGLIFCGNDNLYAFDGASMKPLLTGRNASYLQARLNAGDVILGSFYYAAQSHYYLSMSGSGGGLLFNLDAMQMTTLQNMPIFDGVTDPDNATQQWAVKWWDATGAAPTITKGQLWRVDPLWTPAAANKLDADGTAVIPIFETKSYPEGSPNTPKRFTLLRVNYDLRSAAGAPTVTVTADTKLNTSDAAYVAIGSCPLGTAPQVKGFQILPLTTKGFALEVKLTLSAAADSFEILSLEVGSQPLRAGRSA